MTHAECEIVANAACLHQWSAWGHAMVGREHVEARYCKCGAKQVRPIKDESRA